MMLDFVIPIVSHFFTGNVFVAWIVPVISLAFLACIPCLFRHFLRR